MILLQHEKELILPLLAAQLGNAGQIIPYIKAVLGPEIAYSLSANGAPAATAEIVLDRCVTSGWTHDPPLLLRLLSALQVHEGVPKIIDRLADRPAQQSSPFEARVLVDRRVFLGRQEGRSMMQKLRTGPGYYAGVVNGERLSGKSYTTYFAMHLAQSFKDFSVATVDIPRGTGAGYKAEDLAVALVGGMARSTPLPTNLNPSLQKRVQELATWVLTEAVQSGSAWWFVLDGFDDPDLDPSTFALIEQLVHRISTNIAANRVRVLLLAYAQSIPPALKPAVCLEKPPLARAMVGEPALRECFHQIFSSKGTEGDALQETVEAAVTEVMAAVQGMDIATAEEWLASISEAAQEVVDATY